MPKKANLINFANDKLLIYASVAILFCISEVKYLNAQNHADDSISYSKITIPVKNLYKKELGGFMRPYYGTEYIFPPQRAYGFPFWNTDSLQPGTMTFDNIVYNDIPLMYNIVTQQLITAEPTKGFLIELVTDKVNSFVIGGQHFFTLTANDTNNITKTGWYQQLVKNKYSLWAKRDKEFKLPLKADEATGNYILRNAYYILVNGKFYPVKSKKDVLAVFNDRKEELRSFIKLNKLNFATKTEDALISVVAYYNTLK